MGQFSQRLGQQKIWLAAVLIVTVASLAAVFVAPAQASESQQTTAQLGSSQIFNDDLTVDEGEVIGSNVVLYDGDVKVKDGGRIEGNLVVYSGDIEIDEGGLVTGDVSAFSGDIELKGGVEGNVASWSGDVDLENSARVEGDISVLSGDIKRHRDAYVGGNVVQGPSFALKVPAMVPPLNPGVDAPEVEVVIPGNSGPGFWERIGNLILRLMVGFGITIIFVPLAGLIAYSKPDYIAQVEDAIRGQTALAFAAGLLTNVIVGLLAGFLTVTICLAPIALLAGFLLIALNIVGWTAMSAIVGRRIGKWLQLDSSTAVLVILGALALAAVTVPFFALGGCFRFIAFVLALLIGAFGVGGVIVSWRSSRSEPKQLPPPASAGAIEGPADGPPAPVAPVEPDTVVDDEPQPTEVPPQEDDFTEISGVNAVMDARLKVAGVRTFVDLASMTPEAVADIFSWTVAEVQSEQIIEKAKVLAGM